MKLYAAIDLHSNNSVLVILDERDRVVYERRLPNELPAILQKHSDDARLKSRADLFMERRR